MWQVSTLLIVKYHNTAWKVDNDLTDWIDKNYQCSLFESSFGDILGSNLTAPLLLLEDYKPHPVLTLFSSCFFLVSFCTLLTQIHYFINPFIQYDIPLTFYPLPIPFVLFCLNTSEARVAFNCFCFNCFYTRVMANGTRVTSTLRLHSPSEC